MDRLLQAARKPKFVFTWTGATSDAIDWAFYLVAGVWWIKELSFAPFQLLSLGVAVQATILIMEVPTGVISDLLGRKRAIVLSRVLMGASFFLMAASRNYWLLLPVQVLGGVAWTFRSGSDVAWLSDELQAQQNTDDSADDDEELDFRVERILLRKHRLGMALGSVAIVTAILSGLRSLEDTMRLTGIAYIILAFVTWLLMTENGFKSGITRGKTFWAIFREGSQVVRSRPRLRRIVFVAAGIAFAGDSLDYLGLKRFLDATGTVESSIVAMGAFFLVAVVGGFVVNAIVTRQIGRSAELSRVTAIMFLIAAVGVGIAALSNLWVVIGFGLIIQDSMRETFDPVLEGWVNRDAPSDVRATVHSMVGQAESVADLAGGLVWGMVAQFLSVPTALIGVAFVVAGVAWLAERVPPSVTAAPETETVGS